ncbi:MULTISPECIES: hypothetical protein [Nostocales]|uniref:Uncharacterized protein n=3 Tax=Nostocales TaxID=1161 RepID=A0A0C1NH37_9CYAN|nr:hypothetical protein [Tolypothrix bouteillei]KAF3890537.1 hypothetical protein DA73_0400037610 [Tolypothrix bouteillei VB521301]
MPSWRLRLLCRSAKRGSKQSTRLHSQPEVGNERGKIEPVVETVLPMLGTISVVEDAITPKMFLVSLVAIEIATIQTLVLLVQADVTKGEKQYRTDNEPIYDDNSQMSDLSWN